MARLKPYGERAQAQDVAQHHRRQLPYRTPFMRGHGRQVAQQHMVQGMHALALPARHAHIPNE